MHTVCALFAVLSAGLGQAASTAAGPARPPVQAETLEIRVRVLDQDQQRRHDLVYVARVGRRSPVGAVAFSPDGKTLAAGGYREVLLWDLTTGALSKRAGAGALVGPVRALAYGAQNKLLAVGEGIPSERGLVRLLGPDGAILATLDGPKDTVTCVVFSPDDKLLAAGCADGSVTVWSVADRQRAASWKGHTGAVNALAFSPDGKLLASAGRDRTARVWQVSDWHSSGMTLDQSGSVNGVAFWGDPQYLFLSVGGDTDRSLRIRHWQNGWQAAVVDPGTGRPLGLLWKPGANRAYVPCTDGSAKVVATDRWPPAVVGELGGHGDWVDALARSTDGTRVASACADGTVRLWNAVDGSLLGVLVQMTPNTDRWLAVTSQGYAATSSPDALSWKGAGLKTPPAALKGVLLDPVSVAKGLAAQPCPPPALAWAEEKPR